MRSRRYLSPLALILVLSACSCYVVHGGHIDRSPQEEGLRLPDPFNAFRSEGGRMDVWNSNFRALQDAGVAADRITLDPRGLALPKFSDAPKLGYVLEGSAQVGHSVLASEEPQVRNVNKGDLVAFPRGSTHWLYNNGDQRFAILCITDTSNNPNQGEYEGFYLNGGSRKEWGSSLLQAFDEQLLSEAFNVDRDLIRQVRESQKGTVIVKVQKDVDVSSHSSSDFTHNLHDAPAEVEIDNGGSLRMVTENDFRLLHTIGLSAMHVKLAPEALYAPSYMLNAHAVAYVTRGQARVQIVDSNDKLMDEEVREGSMFAIPQLHPGMVKGSTDGIEMILFATNTRPMLSFLAGPNSAYHNIPVQLLAASDNVPVEVEEQLHRSQRNAMIIPSRDSEKILKFRANGIFQRF